MSLPQEVENIYNEWIKNFPGIGDGGCVGIDIIFLHEILSLSLKTDMKVAEIGCWSGKTSLLIGKTIQPLNGTLYSIDWFEGQVQLEKHLTPNIRYTTKALPSNVVLMEAKDAVENVFKENMRVHNLDQTVNLIKKPSVEAAKEFKDNYFDFIFIDASHDYNSVKADLDSWYPKLKVGGTIAGHDFTEPWELEVIKNLWEKYEEQFFDCKCHPGVIYAVMEKFPNVKNGLGRIWYYNKPGDLNGNQ